MVTIQPRAQSPSRKLANRSIQACLQLFLHFASDFMTGNFWERFLGWVYLYCEEFCEKVNSFTVIPSKTAKSRYFCHSWLFTFQLFVQLLLPTVKLNGVSQPMSIEYKMVHCLNQAAFKTRNFKNLASLYLSSFQVCFRTVLRCYIAWKKMDYLCNC